MDKDLSKYKDTIEAAYTYYRLPVSGIQRGVALHAVKFNDTVKKFEYECISADSSFLSLLNIENISIENIRYLDIFPEEKEIKFDWSAMLGHIARYQSITKFYCYSQYSSKWYKFVAVSPQSGYALLVVEDITGEKEQEIAQNLARQNASNVE